MRDTVVVASASTAPCCRYRSLLYPLPLPLYCRVYRGWSVRVGTNITRWTLQLLHAAGVANLPVVSVQYEVRCLVLRMGMGLAASPGLCPHVAYNVMRAAKYHACAAANKSYQQKLMPALRAETRQVLPVSTYSIYFIIMTEPHAQAHAKATGTHRGRQTTKHFRDHFPSWLGAGVDPFSSYELPRRASSQNVPASSQAASSLSSLFLTSRRPRTYIGMRRAAGTFRIIMEVAGPNLLPGLRWPGNVSETFKRCPLI